MKKDLDEQKRLIIRKKKHFLLLIKMCVFPLISALSNLKETNKIAVTASQSKLVKMQNILDEQIISAFFWVESSSHSVLKLYAVSL